MPETIPNKWNKEKTNDTDSHLVVSDSVNFFKNKALHHLCLEFLEEQYIIDCIDLSILCQFPLNFFDYNNI